MASHFSWQSAVIKTDLEATTKLILLVVGARMNMHGDGAFPSYNTIAKDASVSRSTAIRHINAGIELGWLKKEVRINGLINTSNMYSVSFPNTNGSSTGDTTVVAPVTLGGSSTGDTLTPPVLTPPLTNSEIETAFAIYWSAGMLKTNKKKAFSSFSSYVKANKLCPTEFANMLAKDVKARLSANQMGFDRMHPTTYLNGERWEDQIVQNHSDRDKAQKPVFTGQVV